MSYESWRISYQSSEQAARAAFAEIVRLRAALAAVERERDEAREALADLVSWFDAPPHPPEWRIRSGEYGADDAVQHARDILATPAPQTPSEGGTDG